MSFLFSSLFFLFSTFSADSSNQKHQCPCFKNVTFVTIVRRNQTVYCHPCFPCVFHRRKTPFLLFFAGMRSETVSRSSVDVFKTWKLFLLRWQSFGNQKNPSLSITFFTVKNKSERKAEKMEDGVHSIRSKDMDCGCAALSFYIFFEYFIKSSFFCYCLKTYPTQKIRIGRSHRISHGLHGAPTECNPERPVSPMIVLG